MKSKIIHHFKKIETGRFLLIAICLLVVLDILNSAYLHLYWIKKDFSTLFIHQVIIKNNMVLEDFSSDTLLEMRGLLDNIFYFFLGIIILNNLFFYIFYYRRKIWAQSFVMFYTLTAALFALSFVFDFGVLGWVWHFYNITSFFVYGYLFLGMKILKFESTQIKPSHEKPEQ